MSLNRLITWEEAVFENAFGDALHESDKSLLKPGEVMELHRLMHHGWIREAIAIYIAARWLPLHSSELFFRNWLDVCRAWWDKSLHLSPIVPPNS